MEKLHRIITVASSYGLAGTVFGALTGALAGALAGLVFGDVRQGVVEGMGFAAAVNGVVFAVMGVLSDTSLDSISGSKAMSKPAVLFLCSNNAVRSQMAEALLRQKAAAHFDAYSAGTEPKEKIHPLTIRVMNEIGIDLSGQRPKGLYEYLGRLPVRAAIFVCPRAEEKCPTMWPGALARIEWPFDDPAAVAGSDEERLVKFRHVRDQIDVKLTSWLTEQQVPLASNPGS